jgi:hypothetical protein
VGRCVAIKIAVNKAHQLVENMKESSLKKEAFIKIMEDAGEVPLAIIQGTRHRWDTLLKCRIRALKNCVPCRWYFELKEVERVLLLRAHIETYQTDIEEVDEINDRDWNNMKIYVHTLESLSSASDILEGETYPTASSVIPFLDHVFSNLVSIADKLEGVDKAFPETVLLKLKERFPNGLKDTAPFNSLTLLDPRHMNIYMDEEETQEAMAEIKKDEMFNFLRIERPAAEARAPSPEPAAVPDNPIAKRRAELLAGKRQAETAGRPNIHITFDDALEEEMAKFLSLRDFIKWNVDPQAWWREHAAEFPLLARYYRAHCAFQATSTASERVYNVEGLVFTKHRLV